MEHSSYNTRSRTASFEVTANRQRPPAADDPTARDPPEASRTTEESQGDARDSQEVSSQANGEKTSDDNSKSDGFLAIRSEDLFGSKLLSVILARIDEAQEQGRGGIYIDLTSTAAKDTCPGVLMFAANDLSNTLRPLFLQLLALFSGQGDELGMLQMVDPPMNGIIQQMQKLRSSTSSARSRSQSYLDAREDGESTGLQGGGANEGGELGQGVSREQTQGRQGKERQEDDRSQESAGENTGAEREVDDGEEGDREDSDQHSEGEDQVPNIEKSQASPLPQPLTRAQRLAARVENSRGLPDMQQPTTTDAQQSAAPEAQKTGPEVGSPDKSQPNDSTSGDDESESEGFDEINAGTENLFDMEGEARIEFVQPNRSRKSNRSDAVFKALKATRSRNEQLGDVQKTFDWHNNLLVKKVLEYETERETNGGEKIGILNALEIQLDKFTGPIHFQRGLPRLEDNSASSTADQTSLVQASQSGSDETEAKINFKGTDLELTGLQSCMRSLENVARSGMQADVYALLARIHAVQAWERLEKCLDNIVAKLKSENRPDRSYRHTALKAVFQWLTSNDSSPSSAKSPAVRRFAALRREAGRWYRIREELGGGSNAVLACISTETHSWIKSQALRNEQFDGFLRYSLVVNPNLPARFARLVAPIWAGSEEKLNLNVVTWKPLIPIDMSRKRARRSTTHTSPRLGEDQVPRIEEL